MPVKITKDIAQAIPMRLERLTLARVLVGIPSENGVRKQDDDGPVNNAQLGYIHEFGVTGATTDDGATIDIPARPFLMPGVGRARDDIVKRMRAGIAKTLDGSPTAAEVALATAGQTAVNSVAGVIDEQDFVPLSPVTLRKRRERGRTGEAILMDTGQMRRSITYVVKDRRK